MKFGSPTKAKISKVVVLVLRVIDLINFSSNQENYNYALGSNGKSKHHIYERTKNVEKPRQ